MRQALQSVAWLRLLPRAAVSPYPLSLTMNTLLRTALALGLASCLGLPLCLAASAELATPTAMATASGRERLPLSDGWRFHLGDPAGLGTELSYDVRPEVKDAQENKVADARPEEAAKLAAPAGTVLKPWILPTGNAFIADPARRHVRPAGDPGSDVPFVRADFDDSSWRTLSLPHDWAVEGPFLETGDFGGMGRLKSWGVAWYRRAFDLPATDAGRTVLLEVEGAMSYATVWLNGRLVGGWPFGYSSWQVDLTPYLVVGGRNQLAIRLDNPPSSSRWYPGGGLYRKVWLTKVNPVRVAQWGTFVRTPHVSSAAATVEVEVAITNQTGMAQTVQVSTELFEVGEDTRRGAQPVATLPTLEVTDRAGGGFTMRNLGKGTISSRVVAGGGYAVTCSTLLPKPKLWGPHTQRKPALYAAVTTLTQGGRVVDTYETRFGVRDLRFDPAWGLFVNGERVVIQGVNQHHDLGSLGAAFNVRAAERQLEMLRELGCNAVRMSHNPPAPALLELTDRLGFLVIDESFDCWERKKTPLDFHLIFPDWHEQDMRALVRRDRNHPSVIIWSIGNEVGEQYTDVAGAAIARRLRDIVREEDSTRPVTCAMNFAKPDMPLPAELDLISLNYQGEGIRQDPEFEGTERIRTAPQYPAYHYKFPGKPVLSSETASAFSSRGVYLFPVTPKPGDLVRDGRGGDSKAHHVSAYELHAVDFGSSAEKVFASLDRHPFVMGEFVWTGWDHLGEPTPYYEARSAYAGIIDLAGFRKDRFYLYQSRWRPELPMAHILPHWTWPDRVGQVTPVHVFTSGDEGELFLNGRSLGRRTKQPGHYRLRWDEVVYEPGELKVVTWRKGQAWATATMATAGAAAQLAVSADRGLIAADGEDLSFVTVRVADAQGRTVPRADNRVSFTVEGAGELVSTDNGDPTSFEPFYSPSRKAFSGLCLGIVRAKAGQAGKITVTVRSPGLQDGVVVIEGR